MIALKEALINKNSIKNVKATDKLNHFKCFCVCPEYKDRKYLEESTKNTFIISCEDKYGTKLFFMDRKQVKEFIKIKKSPISLVYGMRDVIGNLWLNMQEYEFEADFADGNPYFELLSEKQLKEL